MSRPLIRVGFFGKLPSRGDFVRVRLSRPVITAWDHWLQSVMPAAQTRFDERWAEVWHAAPGWRFAFGPGVCGPQPVVGVWLPSADRVGRTFPLMIAAEAATPSDAFFDAAERIGADAIRGGAAPDTLARHLCLAPNPAPAGLGGCGTAARWWRTGMERGDMLRSNALPDTETFARMLTP